MTVSYSKKLPDPTQVHVIDFFSGCGGISYAFANTRHSHLGFKILAGIDIDERALQTYSANINAPTLNTNIRKIEEAPESLLRLIPELDLQTSRPLVFIGCAPCQGFSAHRKKDERDDPRNSLLMSFVRICGYYRPDFIVMENVPEILSGKYQEYFREAARHLETAGYNLTIDIVDMSLYGVPQRRRRAIILGSLTAPLKLPLPILTKETAITVRDAISHLTPIEAGNADPDDPCHRAPDHTVEILSRIRKTPMDGGDRRALSAEEQLRCHSSVDNGHTPGFTDVYGRLRWDTPSVTITAKSSTPSCGRFIHPEQHRNISVREAAILQGFPQHFQFRGPLIHQFRQIGEAVPPLFGRFLAWSILDSLRPRKKLPASFTKPDDVFVDYHGSSRLKQKHLAIVDCFSGAGGLALGFEEAGFHPAFAFDNDEDAVKTFNKNVGGKAECLDIRDGDTAKKITSTVDNSPLVIIGGPPCQGFSQQRRGLDDDPRNNLVLYYAKLIEKITQRPLAIVLENVTYLDSPRGSQILASFIATVETMGFRVFRHDLNSADFAVPQLRRRIIIVALRKNIAANYRGPQPLTAERWPVVGEALHGLLYPVGEPDLFQVTLRNHVASREGTVNRRRIAFVDMGNGRLSIPPSLQLICHTKYDGHLDVYGRLDWFSQARTITGGFDSFTRGEYAHPFFHRSITPREAARIQGFPDWFIFEGNRASVRRQIGNAVPPPLAYSIAKAIKRACILAGIIKE